MTSESSRFQHLLQPIRDLSTNWNIDLAQELEEYLDELEHLTIAFDDNGVRTATPTAAAAKARTAAAANSVQHMNFAEAALLIQGTSMIYSRKVEYLYALVYQTLAHFSKQHTGQFGGSASAGGDVDDGGNGDADDAVDADGRSGGVDGRKRRPTHMDVDMFANPLPIYDEIDEARYITLKKTVASTASASTQLSSTPGRPTRKSVLVVPSRENSLQASIALMGSLIPDDHDHGETFKLLSCHLHPSGVLLLDETSKKYLVEPSRRSKHEYYAGGAANQRVQVATPLSKLKLSFDDAMDTSMASAYDGGYDGGGGYDDEDDDHKEPMDDGFDPSGDPQPMDDDIFTSTDIKPDSKSDFGNKSSRQSLRPKTGGFAGDIKDDPWAPLDPYDASKSTVRPFRKGRSYPNPKRGTKNKNKNTSTVNQKDDVDGVDDPAFQERFLRNANRPQWSTWVWNDVDTSKSLEQKWKKKFCKSACLLTTCPTLWRLETKWKAIVRKSSAAQTPSADAILIHEQAEEDQEQQLYAVNRATGAVGVLGASGEDVDITGGAGGQRGEEEDEDDDDLYDGGGDLDYGGADDGDDQWPDHRESTAFLAGGAALFKRASSIGGLGGLYTGNGTGERPQTYEEICRHHLEEFMKGTEQYMRETDLSRQVTDWQDKLSPILKEQEAQPLFDIHEYGREILGHLETSTKPPNKSKSKSKKKTKNASTTTTQDEEAAEEEAAEPMAFDEIVGGRSAFQVCRLFLASLQLANNGNVELVHAKTAADQTRIPFQMALLSTGTVYNAFEKKK